MALIDSMVSTGQNTWQTPKNFFNQLQNIFSFTHDMATSEQNNLGLPCYFTEKNSSLKFPWTEAELPDAIHLYCNPPFGRGLQDKFVMQAVDGDLPTVMLLPVRTGSKRWQEVIFPNASWVCFLKGRLKFEGLKTKSGKPEAAPFDCALVGFNFDGLLWYQHDRLKDLGNLIELRETVR